MRRALILTSCAIVFSVAVRLAVAGGYGPVVFPTTTTTVTVASTDTLDTVSLRGSTSSVTLYVPQIDLSEEAFVTNHAVRLDQLQEIINSSDSFYLRTTSNNVFPGARQMSIDAPTGSVAITISSVTSGQYLAYFQAPTGSIGYIRTGVATIRFRARKGPSGTASIKAEIYIRHSDGSMPEYAESGESESLTTSDVDYFSYCPVTETNLVSTDSVVLAFKVVNQTVNPDITGTIGTNGYSFLSLPSDGTIPGSVRYGVVNGTAYRGDWGNVNSNATVANASAINALTNHINTASITFKTGTVTMASGSLNGTNGVYWTVGTTNFWVLFP